MEAAFKELSRSFTASSRSMVSAVEEVSRACTEIRALSESFRNANITPNAFCPVAKKAPFQVNQPFSFCVVLPYQLSRVVEQVLHFSSSNSGHSPFPSQ